MTHNFNNRLTQRRIAFRSVWYAVRNATKCVAYVPARPALTGGTSWRITGLDHIGEEVSLGVEAFEDHLGRRCLLITVF